MPWIPVLALRKNIDEDTFLFDDDSYQETVYSYKKSGIRSEDIIDFYEFKKDHILVKTRYESKELVIKDTRDNFLNKLMTLDHLFEVKFIESDEEEQISEEEQND